MDRETWWAIVHRVAKSWTRLKQLLCTHALQMKVVVRVSCSGVGIFLYFIIIFFCQGEGHFISILWAPFLIFMVL